MGARTVNEYAVLMKIQAAIFDMDGLLLDTERVCMRVFKQACVNVNLPFYEDVYLSIIGRNSAGIEIFFEPLMGMTSTNSTMSGVATTMLSSNTNLFQLKTALLNFWNGSNNSKFQPLWRPLLSVTSQKLNCALRV